VTFEIGGVDIPDGVYSATLEGTEIQKDGGFDGKGYRKWHFLIDVNGELTPWTALTSFHTGPRSNTRKWLEALLRRPLVIGEKIDDPVGQKVTVVIGRNDNGYAKINELQPLGEPQQILPGVPR
jgi:hypothetical protein